MFALLVLAAAAADTVVQLDPLLVSVLAGIVIPAVTALVTKLNAPSSLKVVVSMVLSAVAGVAVQVNNAGGTFYLKQSLVAVATTFMAQFVAYRAFWQPVVDVNAKAAPGVGLGPAEPPPTPDALPTYGTPNDSV